MCLLPLAEVDEKAGIAKTTAPASRTMGRVKFMDETAWVENILEVLDQPGEWVFSAADRKLYLWPTTEQPSQTINAPLLTELIRVEGGIDIDGPADVPVTGLVFQGLTFTGGERWPWNGATKGELQHKWEHFDAPTALMRLRGARNAPCRAAGLSTRAEQACAWISRAWTNRVIDNEVAHTGGVGILLAGYGPGTKDVNKRNDVSNNWVHHIGEIYWASPAIMVWQSGENRVTHNLIHNTPYSGITVSGRTGWSSETDATFRAREVKLPAYETLPSASSGSNAVHREWWEAREKYMHGRKNFVAWNDIHDVMERMGDGNGIYISGTGKENQHLPELHSPSRWRRRGFRHPLRQRPIRDHHRRQCLVQNSQRPNRHLDDGNESHRRKHHCRPDSEPPADHKTQHRSRVHRDPEFHLADRGSPDQAQHHLVTACGLLAHRRAPESGHRVRETG